MIKKDTIHITPYNCDRTLHIYIPDDLKEGEKLPVLYMFDGHNLFSDSEATYGKSWGMKKYLDETHTHILVVGLECNHTGNERLAEFTPYSFEYQGQWIKTKGLPLIDWMVHELKDYIDANYPTLPDREHTYVGGSSMGGTMALYMTVMHSDIYSKAASVSPHIYPMYKQFKADIDVEMQPDTTIYISWGGYEYETHQLFARVTDQNLQLIRILLKKPGVDVLPHVFKNDNHSESAWEKELHVWMETLGLVNKAENQ